MRATRHRTALQAHRPGGRVRRAARPARRAAALVALVASLGVPAAPGAGALPDSGSVVLRAEEDQELCRELKAGQQLHYRFDANRELVFTAHYHQGSDGRSLWRKDETRHQEGDLTAALDARYCLSWFNYQDSALSLRWQVTLRP